MAMNTLPTGGTTKQEKYAFGSFDVREMLTWLKDLALEPCNMKSSHHRLQNQMLKVRRLLNTSDAESPQKKRKFGRYVNDGKIAISFGQISREKHGNQNAKNQGRGQSSSLSCSPVSGGKWGSLQGTEGHIAFPAVNDRAEYYSIYRQDYSHLIQATQGHVAFPTPIDRAEYCSLCRQDYSHLSDSEESIQGPNPMKQGNLKSHYKDLVTSSSYTHSVMTSIKEKPNIDFSKVLKSFVNEDFDGSSETSHSLSSEKEGMEINQPLKKFLTSKGKSNHLSRLVIPIGPRFQAEVPKWEGTTNVRRHTNDDDLKWLGTQMWPMLDATETNTKGIGKGRPNSCSCDIPGSADCVQQHISEARELLHSEIGATFSSWKFDEMGEDVSKSWTVEEQKEFESLVKLNLPSNNTDFWKLAMEHFPSKSLKIMVNYYYNVYIPKRMSKETRSSLGAVDSDNDKDEDYKNEHDYSARGTKIVPICKLLKSRITNYQISTSKL